MRSALDLSSWQGTVSTLLGLVLVSVVAVGIRLLFMQRVQRRRERENRQINERLKTLIAAYKTLGGSFTGDLAVDPTHLRDLRRRAAVEGDVDREGTGIQERREAPGSDRRRRVRDAVEAALSDVILLGTEEQVRLAAVAANDMVAGRPAATSALVASLRRFIRDALDLEPVPAGLAIPDQGPTRPGGSGGARGGRGDRAGAAGGAGGGRGGGGGGGSGGAGAGTGMAGIGLAAGADADSGGDPAQPAPT